VGERISAIVTHSVIPEPVGRGPGIRAESTRRTLGNGRRNRMTTASAAPASIDTRHPRALGTRPVAYSSVHQSPSQAGAKTILDCGAGQRASARELKGRGNDVRCCDVYPDEFLVNKIPCQYANLNDRIPFDSDPYGARTCLNTLQRIRARGRVTSSLMSRTSPLSSKPSRPSSGRKVRFCWLHPVSSRSSCSSSFPRSTSGSVFREKPHQSIFSSRTIWWSTPESPPTDPRRRW
jgi:hypothetical protein